ncbi:MAG: ParB family transcriptional regulator, chromosome partitioning protein [Patescibacteria group bacterium]|jgi:ParB family chromosome partitioning protein|nr:ParB family transcriptional regulator, chromosome partitioning protein [Patescibacteria group bacterium]
MKGLGKDFSALIPDDMLSEALAVGSSTDSVEQIALDKIAPDPQQPRKQFDETALEELASSISVHGIVQPLIVAKSGSGYIIIAGERRYRAAQLLKLDTVPVIVRSFGDQEKLEISLIENVQREDLTKLELATAYARLHDEFNLDHKEIGQRVGRSESAVVNIIRLLKLPIKAKEALNGNIITEGHARQIVALKEESEQLKLLELIIKNHWTVRQAEQYVVGHKKAGQDQKAKEGMRLTKTETKETKQLSKRLNAPVSIKHMAKGGRLIINFKDESHLDNLMKNLLD